MIASIACFSLMSAVLAYNPQTTQEAWDNHFEAFGNFNLTQIMWDYSEESVARVYDVSTPDVDPVVFSGLAAIESMFVDLFAELTDVSDLSVPVVQVDNDGMVFLVWTAAASGIPQATDTFLFFNDTVTIQYQNIVVNRAADEPVMRRLLQTAEEPAAEEPAEYDPATVQEAWDNHFATFAAQDLDGIMLDYTEESVVRIYNYNGDDDACATTSTCGTVFTGLTEIRGMFASLFEELWTIENIQAPVEIVDGSMVFLVWFNPDTGITWATDTFGFEGTKIRFQNIALESDPIPEPLEDSSFTLAPGLCFVLAVLARFF